MEGTQVFIHYTRKHRPDQLKKTTAFCFVMKHEWLALKVIREACGRAGCVKAAFLHCELQLEPEGHQSCVCASCAGTQIQPFPRFALLLKVNTIDLVAATVGLAAQHLGALQTLWRGGEEGIQACLQFPLAFFSPRKSFVPAQWCRTSDGPGCGLIPLSFSPFPPLFFSPLLYFPPLNRRENNIKSSICIYHEFWHTALQFCIASASPKHDGRVLGEEW